MKNNDTQSKTKIELTAQMIATGQEHLIKDCVSKEEFMRAKQMAESKLKKEIYGHVEKNNSDRSA